MVKDGRIENYMVNFMSTRRYIKRLSVKIAKLKIGTKNYYKNFSLKCSVVGMELAIYVITIEVIMYDYTSTIITKVIQNKIKINYTGQ